MKRLAELLLIVVYAIICLAGNLPAHPGCRYVAESVAVPDGVAVVCAAQQSEQHTETVSGLGFQKLAHEGILLGSVTLTCNDPALTCTDWDLHGHRQWCIGGVANKPYIDHQGGWLQVPDVNREWTVTYRYASQPGRWLRDWKVTDPVTPKMVNGNVQWAATFAGWLGRDLRYQGEFYRDVVEIPNITVLGLLRLDAKAVMNAMYYDPAGGRGSPKAMMLNWGMACLIPASGTSQVTFKNFTLEGNYQDIDWDAFEAHPSYIQISQRMREGPYGAGIADLAMSERVPCPLIYIDGTVTVSGFPSSCVVVDPNTVLCGSTLETGPTVCGRSAYIEGKNRLRKLKNKNFTRTSCHRGGAGEVLDELTYESDGTLNPSPMTDEPGAVASISNARRNDRSKWEKIDIDCRNSRIPGAISIGSSGVFTGKIRGGSFGFPANSKGAIDARIDLEVIDNLVQDSEGKWRPTGLMLSFVSENAQANWKNLDAKFHLRRVDHRPIIDWSNYDEWSRQIDLAPQLRCKQNGSHPEGHKQFVRLRITSDWGDENQKNGIPCQGLIHLPDVAALLPQDIIPTEIWIDGGRFDNQFCQLISINESFTQQSWPANINEYPIKVVFSNASFNVWQPGTPFRGDDTYASQFAILELRNCTTLQNVPIDSAKVIDGTFTGWAEVPQ